MYKYYIIKEEDFANWVNNCCFKNFKPKYTLRGEHEDDITYYHHNPDTVTPRHVDKMCIYERGSAEHHEGIGFQILCEHGSVVISIVESKKRDECLYFKIRIQRFELSEEDDQVKVPDSKYPRYVNTMVKHLAAVSERVTYIYKLD